MANPRKIFSDIYDRYVDKIYRFIFLKVGTQEVAEDLTSEVFTRAWQRFKTSQNVKREARSEAIENIQAFIYRIASNLVVDHYRAKGRAQFVPPESVPMADPAQDLEVRFAVQSDVETIRNAMADLKDEYRETLVWYYLDELSVPEISKITKKSEEAVRVTIHRALQALREQLIS